MEAMMDEHVMWFKKDKQGRTVVCCTCGWTYGHKRPKVQERAAIKHREKYDAEWANQVLGL
jgi:acetone carboxylase gamma subunit